MIPPKPQVTRGVDLDAQGMINGQPTFEHDLMNSYKDDEKPWKKPGLMQFFCVEIRSKRDVFQERILVIISIMVLLKKHGHSIVIDNVVYVQKIISLV